MYTQLFTCCNSFRLGQVANLRSNYEHVNQLWSNTNHQTHNAEQIWMKEEKLGINMKLKIKNRKSLPIWSCNSPTKIRKKKSTKIGRFDLDRANERSFIEVERGRTKVFWSEIR